MSTQNHERVALITGATSGIGVEIARQLVRDGFRVAVSGRSVESGERVAAELGERTQFLRADLLDPGAAAPLIDRTVRAFGRVDVLVNNAAIDHTNDLLEVGESEIRETFEANTFAPMNLLIAAARAMRAQGTGGSIINVTSRLASIGVPTCLLYTSRCV